jgi:4-hydroxythreonine-4-phosphate dehydrogenase
LNSSANRVPPGEPNRPVIAVTTGDPSGVGPEITARLFASFAPSRSAAILVGAPAALTPWLNRAALKVDRDYSVSSDPAEAVEAALGGGGRFVVLDTGVRADYRVGRDTRGGGLHAAQAIRRACELAKNWPVHGMVTAPISKKSLQLAEIPFPGHTEMLAHYLNAPDVQMVMVRGNLRVVPLTRHLPLKEVSAHITEASIVTCVRVVARALTGDFGVESPRIAVAGLNPHAGDGGVLGSEEDSVVVPALTQLRAEGFDLTGPVPADALFPQAYRDFHAGFDRRGRYDAYISTYHDQGLVPFKMLAQRRGVNVTVGLPTVRTSVDHGVAYDIAGRGEAEIDSLSEAYELAEDLCIRRMRGQAEGGRSTV